MSTNNILQDNEIENSLIIKSKYVVMGTSDGQISIVNLTNGQYCGSQNIKGSCLSMCLLYDIDQGFLFACGTSSSQIAIFDFDLKTETFKIVQWLDHLKQDSSLYQIQHLIFDENTYSIYSAVNGIGIFKWLYCDGMANLIKVYPVT